MSTMTDSELRVAVAEASGFVPVEQTPPPYGEFYEKILWCRGDQKHVLFVNLPNYPASLDACAEFEGTLDEDQQTFYLDNLLPNDAKAVPYKVLWFFATASARQRCLAYLATVGHPLLATAYAEAVASRAVPITAETVVPFPCWCYFPEHILPPRWLRFDNEQEFRAFVGLAPWLCTHYHPDQPTAPTSTPHAGDKTR